MKHLNQATRKTALITGAARRIGAEIAQYLHAEGFNVVIHCNTSFDAAEKIAKTLNAKRHNSAKVIMADLSDGQQITGLIAQACEWQQRLDVLINNASVFFKSSILQNEVEKWNALFTINVKAPYFLSQVAFPWLLQHQGCIINITDIHGERPLKDYTIYCQTKAALVMQTKALAREMAPNVRVNAVAPGAILWPEQENGLTQIQKTKIIKKTPLDCHGDPKAIAQAVMAQINNQFVTGQIWSVDGGRSLC